METCLVLVPARGGSKGIPRKNMARIGGHPLVAFALKAALAAALPGRICLSTDDPEIRDFGLACGVEVPFLRPPALARDESSTASVVSHALSWYQEHEGFSPGLVVLLQPTCPFRRPADIRGAYDMMAAGGSDSLVSVNVVRNHPCEYIVRRGTTFSYVMDPPAEPGRQHFPMVYFLNGAIYICRTSFFLGTGQLYDEHAHLYLMGEEDSLDIDEPADLEYARCRYAGHGEEFPWMAGAGGGGDS